MTLQFMATLIGLLNDRQTLQRMVWKQHGYSPQNKYNKCCGQLEALIEELLELIDDHDYRSVLNISFKDWEFIKSEQ
jgi:hypothetical protein